MKIGFLITYFYPQTGGAENNCYYLARELAKKHEVHVFCSGNEDKDEVIDKIHIHRCKETFRFKYYFAFYPSIVKKLQEFNLDILHVHGFGFTQHDIAIKKLKRKNKKIKIVCTPHGPFMALNKYNFIGNIFKKLYTLLIRRSLINYDLIFEVNPYQYKWMNSEYKIPKSKISLLPNGINEDIFKNSEKSILNKLMKKYDLQNKLIITYLGRIQKYKGLDQIIKSLPNISNNAVFVAIGKDVGDKSRLESLAKDLKVENRLIFTGEVSEKEKPALLQLSDIFIFPSEWEAFGIAMLEAMAKGNAIISTKTEGGQYLIKKDNGLLYNNGNVKELQEKLNLLISNKKLREKMQIPNIKKAKQFLWKDIAVTLEKYYKSLNA